jgi:Predicted glycosyltransferase involved in capsule biosynthesis
MTQKILSVIVPVCANNTNKWIVERLNYPLQDREIPWNDVQFLFVDYNSSSDFSDMIRNFCSGAGVEYIRSETVDRVFRISSARNIGAQHATGDFLLFLDIDLLSYDGFYHQIIREIKNMQQYEGENHASFIMTPVIYLSATGTQHFLQMDPEIRKPYFWDALIDKRDLVERYSTGTSAVVVSRYAFCALGGYPEEFSGWGGEDIAFNIRLIRRWKKYPSPEDFPVDLGNMETINIYHGWKAMYRLHGDRFFKRGLCLFHAWHPVNNDSTYKELWKFNQEKMDQVIDDSHQPWNGKVFSYNTNERSVVIDSNAFTVNSTVSPFWGRWSALDKDRFPNAKSAVSCIKDEGFTRVVFHNPYKSPFHQELYDEVRRNNMKYTVCERGALADSVFYDNHGFNADSTSYRQALDTSISDDEVAIVSKYIAFDKLDIKSLEQQHCHYISDYRKRRGIPYNKKVIFIPLQRFTDTVTRVFLRGWGSYFEFIEDLAKNCRKISGDWVIVVKPHPLEDVIPVIPGAIIETEAHFKEILLASDMVYTLNSGVGVYALMYDLPVYVSGMAFYEGERLAMQVDRLTDVIDCRYKMDALARLKFTNFLINKFYSFGSLETRAVIDDFGFRMTATTGIDLHQIVVDGKRHTFCQTKNQTPSLSLLFDRYVDMRQPTDISKARTPVISLEKESTTKTNLPIVTYSAGDFRILKGTLQNDRVTIPNSSWASICRADLDTGQGASILCKFIFSKAPKDSIEVKICQNGADIIFGSVPKESHVIYNCRFLPTLPIRIDTTSRGKFSVILEDIAFQQQDFSYTGFNKENFSEERYLEIHADVRKAVESGVFPDGWAHFIIHGRFEGRKFK